MSIALRGIAKQFGEFAAVKDIDLDVPTGALIALLGPSGCGKTTLLRIIAGLETPDEGQVLFDGRDATQWPIRDRNVGESRRQSSPRPQAAEPSHLAAAFTSPRLWGEVGALSRAGRRAAPRV